MEPLSLSITEGMDYSTMPIADGLNIAHDHDASMDQTSSAPATAAQCDVPLNVRIIAVADVSKGAFLGLGAYGRVCEGLWRRTAVQSTRVAIKYFESRDHERSFRNEVEQLAKLSDENIIELYGVFTTIDAYCIVIEFMADGSLYDLLHGKNTRKAIEYTMGHAISWMRQAAKAVRYLHDFKPKPILHRDLKPGNILLCNASRTAKLADFGTAIEQRTIVSNMRGSAPYMAPEVFSTTCYTERCDVFSMAICLWEVLARRRPYANMHVEQPLAILWAVHQRNQRPDPLLNCPKVIEDLLNTGWAAEPSDRPSMATMHDVLCDIQTYTLGGDEPITRQDMNHANVVEVPLRTNNALASPMVSSTGNVFDTQIVTPTMHNRSNVAHMIADVVETDIPSLSISSGDIRANAYNASLQKTTHRRGGSYDTALIVTNCAHRPSSLLIDALNDRMTAVYSPDTEQQIGALQEFLRPLAAIKGNDESEDVFRKHAMLVKQYSAIKHDIDDLANDKDRLNKQIELRQKYEQAVSRRADYKREIENMQAMLMSTSSNDHDQVEYLP